MNLARGLSTDELRAQGFVTVDHSFDQMKDLNDIEQHVIAKDANQVVAYVLAMTKASRALIPVLVPMFDVFDDILYHNKRISEYNYIVVGQVCVAKEYRGRGIFDGIYEAYKNFYQHKYDFAITEIALTNTRSIAAHKRIGFEEIHRYKSPDGVEWSVVVWEWVPSSGLPRASRGFRVPG